MGKSKPNALLTACLMILLCGIMIIGGTFALWSDKVEINHHLSAGSLKVTLRRTYLETYTLGDDAYMTTTTDDTIADVADNVFGMDDQERIVPTSSYAARLRLTNSGNVAFDYTVQIVVKDDSNTALSKQVKVFIGEGEIGSIVYDEGRYLATETEENVTFTQFTVGSGTMDSTQTEKEFWVKLVFEDRIDNNEAQDKQAAFDLLVTATQKTTKTTA